MYMVSLLKLFIIASRSILDNLPNITHVVYMEDPLQQRVKISGFRAGVKILPFESILREVGPKALFEPLQTSSIENAE